MLRKCWWVADSCRGQLGAGRVCCDTERTAGGAGLLAGAGGVP